MIKLQEIKKKDINKVEIIIEETKAIFKEMSIDQWQNGYPNKETIEDDFKEKTGYIIVSQNEIVGYFSLQYTPDPNYEIIEGKWNYEEDYATIHRFVISPKHRRKGFAKEAFILIEDLLSLDIIRVDTAFENKGMRNLLKELNYEECGKVWVSDGERLAYDKNIRYGKINNK